MPAEVLIRSFAGKDFNIAKVFVGEEKKMYQLPLDHISAIPFFNKALNGSFKEGLSKSIELPEDEPAVFELLVRWLYRGLPADELNKKEAGNIVLCTKLFLLADRLCLPELTLGLTKDICNLARAHFILNSSSLQRPEFEQVSACVHLTQGHAIRYVFVNAYATSVPTKSAWPSRFLEKIADTTFPLDFMRWSAFVARINGYDDKVRQDFQRPESKASDQSKILIPLLFESAKFPSNDFFIPIVNQSGPNDTWKSRTSIRKFLEL